MSYVGVCTFFCVFRDSARVCWRKPEGWSSRGRARRAYADGRAERKRVAKREGMCLTSVTVCNLLAAPAGAGPMRCDGGATATSLGGDVESADLGLSAGAFSAPLSGNIGDRADVADLTHDPRTGDAQANASGAGGGPSRPHGWTGPRRSARLRIVRPRGRTAFIGADGPWVVHQAPAWAGPRFFRGGRRGR